MCMLISRTFPKGCTHFCWQTQNIAIKTYFNGYFKTYFNGYFVVLTFVGKLKI